MGYTPDRTHRDIQLRTNLKDVLSEVKNKFECLIIFSHPQDKNGLLEALQPNDAAELIQYADACEFFGEQEKNKLISTGILNSSFFENFAIIENTDPKRIEEIGSKQRRNAKIRSTYYKLSEISIHALQIAFQEPKIRIRIYDKPNYQYDKIRKIKIEGNQFLKNVELNFHEELNCLIGGRGVGKSAIIESIRYCLKAPYYSEQSFKEEFIENIVGSGGKITLIVSRFLGDKIYEYSIERVIGAEPSVKDYQSSPAEILENSMPVIIGQKEFYHLVSDKNYLLNLIDQLIGEEIKIQENIFNEKLSSLKENQNKYIALLEALKNKENDEQKLKNLEDNLKIFNELGVVEKMQISTHLLKDENILKNQLNHVEENIQNFTNAYNDLISSLNVAIEELSKGSSNEKGYLLNVTESLKNLLENIEKSNILKHVQPLNIKEKLNEWEKLKSKYSEEINQIKKELGERNIQVDKYESYVKEKNIFTNKLKSYETQERELHALKEEREQLKAQLLETHHNLFEIRKTKLEAINQKLEGRLKLKIEYQKNKDDFTTKLRTLLKGSNVQSTAIENITNDESANGLEISKFIKQGKQALQEKYNLTETMAERIKEWFKDEKKLFELETLFPKDKVTIELKDDNDYKELEKLSVGQKATALLILLFSDEKRILIIDQPEDDLDNRFIYEDVVKFLISLKGKRQLIFATHNANIPLY